MLSNAYANGMIDACVAFGMSKEAARKLVTPAGKTVAAPAKPAAPAPEAVIGGVQAASAAQNPKARRAASRAVKQVAEPPGFFGQQAAHARDFGRGLTDLAAGVGLGGGATSALGRQALRQNAMSTLGAAGKGLLPSAGLAGLGLGGLALLNSGNNQ